MTESLRAAVAKLVKQHVLVGVPDKDAERPPAPGETKAATNSVVGYVMEFGDPEKNIPARPFLIPGVEKVQDQIAQNLRDGAERALSGNLDAVDAQFTKIGETATNSVKAVIRAGQFAPLSERTIVERAERRYKDTGRLLGNKANREARQFLELREQGVPEEILHEAGLAKPLNDTLSLLNSIKYVVQDKAAK